MAFQRAPNTVEIVVHYTGYGSEMVNVLAAQKEGGYDLEDLETLANGVDNSVGGDWLPLQSEDVFYTGVSVRGLDQENDLEAFDDTNAEAGEVLSAGASGNVTLAIKKVSGFTGRSARGRLFWIGLPDAALDTNKNVVLAASVALIIGALTQSLVNITNQGFDPVIISRFNNKIKRDEAELFPWLSVVAVNDNVDSQRRRLL